MQIENAIQCEFIHVEGDDGQHFNATIVSIEFRAKSIVEQHKLVYDALGEKMGHEIHALSMKTLTPEQWEKYK
tara:strand:+ start:12606 stop:12824 length:219 start_codon:yes stop_codon:yes gene_type:complete